MDEHPCEDCGEMVPEDEFCGLDKPDGETEYLCEECFGHRTREIKMKFIETVWVGINSLHLEHDEGVISTVECYDSMKQIVQRLIPSDTTNKTAGSI